MRLPSEPIKDRWREELDHKLRAAGLPGPLRDVACKLNDLESDTMIASECGIHLAEAMARLGLIQVFRPVDGATIGAVDLRSDDPIRITALGLLVLQWVDSIL